MVSKVINLRLLPISKNGIKKNSWQWVENIVMIGTSNNICSKTFRSDLESVFEKSAFDFLTRSIRI